MVVQRKTAYPSLLITHKDIAIRTLANVIAQRCNWCLVMAISKKPLRSVPRYFAVVNKGINEPKKLFWEAGHGSHESNLMAALSRDVYIATNNTSELDNFQTAKPELVGMLQVIWKSRDVLELSLI